MNQEKSPVGNPRIKIDTVENLPVEESESERDLVADSLAGRTLTEESDSTTFSEGYHQERRGGISQGSETVFEFLSVAV